ncbi:hypothetical protein F4811DRAFT_541855 [Daldinia bambusicola]|nr:hypothetical protein F4811DRAFT_541855 [Daldinia bambusicola]
MFSLSPSSILFTAAVTTAAVSAAQVGYFNSESCVDPSGLEQCYADADTLLSDCVTSNCKGQSIDCINICHCINTENQIDCAGRHCWNQVYSCEYQQTAGEIATYCLNPDLEAIPFFPPPDNAPGSCSCNVAKVLISIYRTVAETETCGANGEEIASQLGSLDEIQHFSRACQCCSQSGMLSAFSEICPNTDPSLLGMNEIYNSLVASDEDWPMCAAYMEEYPCVSKLGYTPPGDDNSAVFYEPGKFPSNGTATTSNIAGSITSPVSGATYSWTYDNLVQTVTVVSAESRPTNAAGADDEGNGGSESDSANDEDKGGNSGSGTDTGDKKNMAPSAISGLLPAVCGLFVLLIAIL